jgi:diguanylate cyclase (GGDEF)-like protein
MHAITFINTMEAQLKITREGLVTIPFRNLIVGEWVKRLFDVVAASVGLIVLMPLFLIVGILIKRDSEGPVFYRGSRVGKGGRIFQILKFRTMHENAASYNGPRLTSSEDQRITPLGRWLRNTKINELPQLWNIIRGDMSLVGPRPEDPEIVKHYPPDVRDEVLCIRPGITSPASVLYHSEQEILGNEDVMGKYLNEILPDKLRLDHLYVRNRSFISDIDIIFWTLAVFIPKLAKTNISEGYLFAGPLSRFVYRHFSWFLIDMVVVFIATSMAAIAWRTQDPLNWGWECLLALSVGFALVFSAVNYIFGLNSIVWSKAAGDDAFGLLFSAAGATSVVLYLNYLQGVYQWLPFPAIPTILILSIGLLSHFGFLCVRYRLRLFRWLADGWSALRKNNPGTGERTLILGEGETCHIASWLLRRGMFRHVFSIVGIVANDDPTKQGMQINGCRVVGGVRDLQALIRQYDVHMIVYTLSGAAAPIRDTVIGISKTSHVKVVYLDDLVRYVSQRLDNAADTSRYLDAASQRIDGGPLYDALTGLPNSILLQERLRQSLAYSKRYHTTPALLLVDLNGSAGQAGVDDKGVTDELMKQTAKRLARFRRESDTLARLRAGEFALLLENIPNNSAATKILRRTQALMAEPVVIGDAIFSLQPDIGIHFPVGNLEDLQRRLHLSPPDEKAVARPVVSKTIGAMAVAGRSRTIGIEKRK